MAGFFRRLKTAKPAKRGQSRADTPDSDAAIGPSPNPMTNVVLATVALRGGGILARRGIERALLGRRYSSEKAKNIVKGRTMKQTLLSAAAARVATTSVPGAILVGSGLLAKTLYDRHKGRAAEIEGEKTISEIAEKGDQTES